MVPLLLGNPYITTIALVFLLLLHEDCSMKGGASGAAMCKSKYTLQKPQKLPPLHPLKKNPFDRTSSSELNHQAQKNLQAKG